jgi:diguanylate cyclase (GGDEF)-like protein
MVIRTSAFGRCLLGLALLCLGVVLLRNLGLVGESALSNFAYHATQLVAIVACGLRASRVEGPERAAWALLTAGLAGFAAGDLYYAAALENDPAPPFPAWSDVGWLSVYPAVSAALLLLLRARAPRMPWAVWIDGLVCGLACAGVGAALVFGALADPEGSPAAVAISLAYPLGDFTLLAFAVAVVVITGRHAGATWRLLALAFAAWALADVVYLYRTASGPYEEYTLLDTSWPAVYTLIAFAAWQPSRRLDTRRLRAGMLALPAICTTLALGLLVYDHYARLNYVALCLATATVVAATVRFAVTFRANLRKLGASESEASTDALTGLGNRRALMRDLQERSGGVLALYDLDGFKAYNDTFGHPAGDALLARLGANLRATLGAAASAYRMGGDEFCVLAHDPALLERAAGALSETGDRFVIRCSYGWAELGEDPVDALRGADQQMYANKRRGRRSNDEAVHQVLLAVAAEHDGALHEHVEDVAGLAGAVVRELGLGAEELLEVRRAAALHDIGKVAIPDAILDAPRALTAEEWGYMRRHTVIGERIIRAAPELAGVATIVRSSHERWDGGGYPDGLAGEEIPLGARIVAVCDSFDAIVTDRAYRRGRSPEEALAELRRCAGTQFDPQVVAAFALALERTRTTVP